MTEDILIRVRGLHTMEDEKAQDEEIEIFSIGKYYRKNGKHYIMYEELVEDLGAPVKNRIILKDGYMELKKTGPVCTTLTFQRDQKSTSWYNTPMGNLFSAVTVKEMQVEEQEDQLDIRIDYELELNYEHMADAKIEIRAVSKEKGISIR